MPDSIETRPKPPASMSEAEYLHQEEFLARLAVQRVLQEVKGDLIGCADPRVWARRYPLPTVAVALGVAAVAAHVGRSKLVAGDEHVDEAADRRAAKKRKKKEKKSRESSFSSNLIKGVGATLLRALLTPARFDAEGEYASAPGEFHDAQTAGSDYGPAHFRPDSPTDA